MSDHEPLRRYGERGPNIDALGRDLGTRARTMRPSRRSGLSVALGLVLVAASVAALFWFRGNEPEAAAIATGAVEADLGPVLDLRTNDTEPEPEPEPEPEVALNDDLPVTAPAGGAKILKVPREPAPAPPRETAIKPLAELIEDAPEGPLPRISDAGLTPFAAYSVPDRAAASRVAIVVGGLGLSQTGTQAAIKALPSSVTLGFSPDGASIDRWTQAARREGHELALQVPMEPVGWPSVNPGRHTLTREASDNPQTLREAMGRVFTYASVMPYSGTAFLQDEAALTPVMREVASRGLAWVDNGRNANSRSSAVRERLRREGLDLPAGRTTIVLDDDRDPDAIDRQLDALAQAARRDGRAIALASAFDVSVERIALFARTARKRGIRVVPLSNLLR